MHGPNKTHRSVPAGEPVRIDPDAWYSDADLRLVLGIAESALRRARRSGELRYTRKGKACWHLGAWINSWLGGAAGEAVRHAR